MHVSTFQNHKKCSTLFYIVQSVPNVWVSEERKNCFFCQNRPQEKQQIYFHTTDCHHLKLYMTYLCRRLCICCCVHAAVEWRPGPEWGWVPPEPWPAGTTTPHRMDALTALQAGRGERRRDRNEGDNELLLCFSSNQSSSLSQGPKPSYV